MNMFNLDVLNEIDKELVRKYELIMARFKEFFLNKWLPFDNSYLHRKRSEWWHIAVGFFLSYGISPPDAVALASIVHYWNWWNDQIVYIDNSENDVEIYRLDEEF